MEGKGRWWMAYRVDDTIMASELPDGAACAHIPQEDLPVSPAGGKPARWHSGMLMAMIAQA